MQPDELPIKEVGDRQSKEIKGEENQAKQFQKKSIPHSSSILSERFCFQSLSMQ